MEKYLHTKQFVIKYCDVDFKDQLKVSEALALMEEVACSSADELGFGYPFVKPRGYAFMVTNVCLEILQPINLGEEITVCTWPTPPSYVVFGREYQFLSQTGELLINASSRWCLFDLKESKILQSKMVEGQDYSTYNTDKALDDVRWKIPTFLPEEGELRFTITIANSEYDHNMHVNNTRYADYCFNCFTVAELAQKSLRRFQISYIKQCKEGETLRFYLKELESGSYLAHGFNEKGETVVQSLMVFEE